MVLGVSSELWQRRLHNRAAVLCHCIEIHTENHKIPLGMQAVRKV